MMISTLKENKPAPFHLHPSPVPLGARSLLSQGVFTREHHTIYFKPEIRTVLIKTCHPAVLSHMHAKQP